MLSVFATLAARCLAIALFLPFSALDKILNSKQAIAQAEEAVSPRSLATILLMVGFALEIVMSVAILSGIADRLAAFILAGYCIITALLWKRFWKVPDFRLRGESRGRETFWDFLKNLALAGGFLLLAFGTNSVGAQRFFDYPFASSYPYSTVDREIR